MKHDFGSRMQDYDGRDLDVIALYHQRYESPDLKQQSNPGYWNFLEAEFDPREEDAKIGLQVRRLDDVPSLGARGGGEVRVRASSTGRTHASLLPETRTLPNAEVRLTYLDGRPIRGGRSAADGRVLVSGLVEVPAGETVLLTAYDGSEVEALTVKTVGLG